MTTFLQLVYYIVGGFALISTSWNPGFIGFHVGYFAFAIVMLVIANLAEIRDRITLSQDHGGLPGTYSDKQLTALKRQESREEIRAQQAEAEEANKNIPKIEVPKSAKLAATAYVGYKVGKKIGKW